MAAPFEQDPSGRFGGAASDFLEQGIIEGVAGTDLENVDLCFEGETELGFIHDFDHEREPCAGAGFEEDFEGGGVALVGIGHGAWFPDPTAEELGTGLGDGGGGFEGEIRFGRVHSTGAGDEEGFAPEGDPGEGEILVGQFGMAVEQPVGGFDVIDAVDVIEADETVEHQFVTFVSENGVDVAVGADDFLDVAAEFFYDGGDFPQLGGRQGFFTWNDHVGNRMLGFYGRSGNGEIVIP